MLVAIKTVVAVRNVVARILSCTRDLVSFWWKSCDTGDTVVRHPAPHIYILDVGHGSDELAIPGC